MSKRKGNRLEHKSIKLLESWGYSCTRSAASLGIFDIIAISPYDVKCVQVKANRWPGREERERLVDFQVKHRNVMVEIWRWDDYARNPKIRFIGASDQWVEDDQETNKAD